MDKERILRDQYIDQEKLTLARRYRRDMTPAENLFWKHVRNRRFRNLKFRRQQILDGFIADFFCKKLKTVVEIDGKIHDYRKKYDNKRDGILKNKGLRILRFSNEDVLNNIDKVLERIYPTNFSA